MGDFNVVSSSDERIGKSSYLKRRDMVNFNSFVDSMNLIDPPVYGKKYTNFCSNGIVASRLDRFLISDGIMNLWKVKGQRVGNKHI